MHPSPYEEQRETMLELMRATNLLLNEVTGTVEGGVKQETIDRATRAYVAAAKVVRLEMYDPKRWNARNEMLVRD